MCLKGSDIICRCDKLTKDSDAIWNRYSQILDPSMFHFNTVYLIKIYFNRAQRAFADPWGN